MKNRKKEGKARDEEEEVKGGKRREWRRRERGGIEGMRGIKISGRKGRRGK